MNEDRLLKAVKVATSVEVSSRTDDAVLKAAREKAAEMRAASASAGKIMRRRRIMRIAAVAAALVLACGATLIAGRMGWIPPLTYFLGYSPEPESGKPTVVVSQEKQQHGWESATTSGGEIGGDVPTNDEPYPMMFFRSYNENPSIDTEDQHVSTFAADVDTGSYTIIRRYLNDGHLPPEKAVRTEEFLNYFDYGYKPPDRGGPAIYIEGAPSKFGPNENYYLLRIGVKEEDVSPEKRMDANLVILVDVSASMGRGDRIGLVRKSLRMLLDSLRPEDKVAIIAFGEGSDTVLKPTPVKEKDAIIHAVESLAPQAEPDTTNLEAGLQLAYQLADKMFDEERINRVILCSDGVANTGATGPMSLHAKVLKDARKGICLSAIGFGIGNYNDYLMEQLADNADGNYAYIDTLEEAKRVFVDNLVGMLQVDMRDVRIQVDFNPAVVKSYRLIGYENRALGEKNAEGGDGGEIGAGQAVTALYEIKFRKNAENGRVASVSVKYSDPHSGEAESVEKEIARGDFGESFDNASTEFRLAAGVAEFAEVLRKSVYADKSKFADVLPVIQDVLKERPDDAAVTELLSLIAKANKIQQEKQNSTEPQE
jgi:Ca-activated chloride channel family protein